MKVKKLLLLLVTICLALVFSSLYFITGCGTDKTTTVTTTESTKVEPIKLIFGSLFAPTETFTQGFEAWAKDFEERTGGRYTVEISAGGILGGPSEYYDLVTSGVCDIACVPAQYAERPFLMSGIVNTPFVSPSSTVTSEAYFEYYKKGYMDEELADVVLLFLHSPGPANIHTTEKPLNTLADCKGLKIRSGGGPTVDIQEAMGLVPVFIPGSESYIALEKGTVDGIWVGWAAIGQQKMYEVLNYSSGPQLSGGMVFYIMNKETYESMPQDVRAIIDEMRDSGEYLRLTAGLDDEAVAEAKETCLEYGYKIIEWSPAEMAKLDEVLAPVWAEWIADREAQGLPGKKAADDWYSILKGLGVENPTPGYTPGG